MTFIGAADDLVDAQSGDGIADRGVAKVAILGEYRDLRFPQGELIALQRGPDLVTEPALLALQRTQPGDVDRRAGDALDLPVGPENGLDVQGVEHAAFGRHIGDVAVLRRPGGDDPAFRRDHGIALGGGQHLLVGAAQKLGADPFTVGADHGSVAQIAVLEEHMHLGAAQRRLDAGSLLPQVLGTFGHPLVDVPPEHRIQPPSEGGRHCSSSPCCAMLAAIVFWRCGRVTNVGIDRHQSEPEKSLEPDVGPLSVPSRRIARPA